jgi:riboflavin biosynthesis pyrimidine reductase
MGSSVDGKTDGAAMRDVMREGEYEALHQKLGGDAWICGRTTMQQHFAEPEPFVSKTNTPAGPQPVCVAKRAKSYAISVDTTGKLNWASNDLSGDHLICVLSEKVPTDYLAMLREKQISYIVCGQTSIDLTQAVRLLGEHFGIRTLLLEGGGHINGGFLKAGLVDELSLLVVPCIDGRHNIAAVFDGISAENYSPARLRLKSLEERPGDALWLRYEIIHP